MRRTTAILGMMTLAACGGGGGADTTKPPEPVASVSFAASVADLVPQQTAQLTATTRDGGGNTLSGRPIAWSVAPSNIATVSASGLLTATAPGNATVSATSEGKSANTIIVVKDGGFVTVSGGTVSAAAGKVQMVFPAGAVSSNTAITAAPITTLTTTSPVAPGTAVDLGPNGSQFASPVTLKLKYNRASLSAKVDESFLRLYLITPNGFQEVPGSTVDVATQTVTGAISHFSGWIVCQFPCGPDEPHAEVSFDSRLVDLKQGSSVLRAGSATRNNYPNGSLTFSLSPAPVGVTVTGTLGAWGGDHASATITFNASANAPPGLYEVNVVTKGVNIEDSGGHIFIKVSAPSYTLTPSVTAPSVVQGNKVTSTLTLARDGVAGSIALSAVNLPAGVTASFNPASLTGATTTSVLTLTATAAAPPGNFNTVIVRGKTAGVPDVDVGLPVTVVSSSLFSLAGTPPFVSLSPGASSFTGLKLTRASGFTGALAYTISSAQIGLTSSLATTSVADSLKLTVSATIAVPFGTYPITVSAGNAAHIETIQVLATVASAGTTIVQLDFSACLVNTNTIWLAYQDGSGAFTRLAGSAGVFAFPITAGRGAYAAVVSEPGRNTTFINFGTPAELPLAPICSRYSNTNRSKRLTISASSMLANNFVDVTVGGSGATLQPALPSQTFDFVRDGPLDIVAWRYNRLIAATDVRGFIRRDVDAANNSTVPVLDMAGAESFAPASATVSFSGVGAEATTGPHLGYITGAGCRDFAILGNSAPQSATVFGVPASVQRATDLHDLFLTTATRSVNRLFHTMTSQTITLGATMPIPTATTVAGSYRRVQVAFTLPADYVFASYGYSEASNSVVLQGNTGYFGSGTMTLTMPDLSGLAGFSTAWMPASNSHGTFGFTGLSAPASACADGAIFKSIRLSGTN